MQARAVWDLPLLEQYEKSKVELLRYKRRAAQFHAVVALGVIAWAGNAFWGKATVRQVLAQGSALGAAWCVSAVALGKLMPSAFQPQLEAWIQNKQGDLSEEEKKTLGRIQHHVTEIQLQAVKCSPQMLATIISHFQSLESLRLSGLMDEKISDEVIQVIAGIKGLKRFACDLALSNVTTLAPLGALRLDFLSLGLWPNTSHTKILMETLEKVPLLKLRVDGRTLNQKMIFAAVQELEIECHAAVRLVLLPDVEKVAIVNHDFLFPVTIDRSLEGSIIREVVVRGQISSLSGCEFSKNWIDLRDRQILDRLYQLLEFKKEIYPVLFGLFDYQVSCSKREGYRILFTRKESL